MSGEARAGPGAPREIQEACMRVVIVEPGEDARIADIDNELHALQEAVGGYIETVRPFRERVCMIINEEGKLNGMRRCRVIIDGHGRIVDFIFGPIILCGVDEEDFCGLTEEQAERYRAILDQPVIVQGKTNYCGN